MCFDLKVDLKLLYIWLIFVVFLKYDLVLKVKVGLRLCLKDKVKGDSVNDLRLE